MIFTVFEGVYFLIFNAEFTPSAIFIALDTNTSEVGEFIKFNINFCIGTGNAPKCNSNIIKQINRVNLIESIRIMINFQNCRQFEESYKEYDSIVNKLETIYSSYKDELTEGLIKNLKGDGRTSGQICLAVKNCNYFLK